MSSAFIKTIKTFIFDCDGVLWRGKEIIEGSRQTIKILRNRGLDVLFVTNNNTITRKEFLKKLNDRGFEASEDDVYCSSFLVAAYLKSINFTGKVYVVGSSGIANELNAQHIDNIGLGRDDFPQDYDVYTNPNIELDKSIKGVVVGYDKHLSLRKITLAMKYLEDKNNIFVATNPDTTYPIPDGSKMPGSGVMVRSVATAAERDPVFVGKPSAFCLDIINKCRNLEKEFTCMIGDRIDTDIHFAHNCGIRSILVLSGVTKKETVDKYMKEGRPNAPDFVMNSIKDLEKYLSN